VLFLPDEICLPHERSLPVKSLGRYHEMPDMASAQRAGGPG
jgi:hypothetical protein